MIRSTPMAHMVNCVKLGREAEGLDYPPLPGALGMKIYNNVSKEAWEQWKHLQTMIVNETAFPWLIREPANG